MKMFSKLFGLKEKKQASAPIAAWAISSMDKYAVKKEMGKKLSQSVVDRAVEFAEEFGMYDGKYCVLHLSRAGHYEGDRYVGPVFDLQWKADVMRI